MKAAAIYARISTPDQINGYSLSTQVDACRKYAAQHGFGVADEHIFRENYTGASLQRPELNILRKVAASGIIHGVLVLDVDRLARNAVHQLLIEEDFTKHGAPVIYVNDQSDVSLDSQIQRPILSAFAEYEPTKVKERSQRGSLGRALAGHVCGGRCAPYGYRYISGRHIGSFEIEPAEAKVVATIYTWYVSGDETAAKLGCQAIAHRLSACKIPTKLDTLGCIKAKRRTGVWSISTVKRILKNELYKGVWNYNKTKSTGMTTHAIRSRQDWISVRVPAIVSPELWAAAQRQSDQNKIVPRSATQLYLMKSRLKCAVCDYTFLSHTDRRIPHRVKSYYSCGGQKVSMTAEFKDKPCHRSLRQDVWNDRIWRTIIGILEEPSALFAILGQAKAESEAEQQSVYGWLSSLESKASVLQRKQAQLLEIRDSLGSNVSRALLDQTIAALDQESDSYHREIEQLRSQLDQGMRLEQNFEELERYSRMAAAGLDLFTDEEKRWVIDVLDIRGVVTRGMTPDLDRIALTGLIPPQEVVAGSIRFT
jgi:site-specific DNA recombinase